MTTMQELQQKAEEKVRKVKRDLDSNKCPREHTSAEKRAIIGMQARAICDVVATVENRCMAADGPVTPTLREMEEEELRTLWKAADKIRQLTGERK